MKKSQNRGGWSSGWSSDTLMTSETLSRSSVSTNYSSDASALPQQDHPRTSKNPVKYAAKAVAGAFFTCFTPPQDDHDPYYHTLSRAARSNSPSVRSDTRSIRSEKIHGTVRPHKSLLKGEPGSSKFTLSEIYKATENFSPSLKIGQGGFGTVYKATLPDGKVVAAKRAKRIEYGKQFGLEFQCEARMLAQVEHLNLVRFYGFLEEEDERILLVEYVPNGNLREHLDGIRGDALDMAARLDIAIDVAHAITYLHMYADKPIIHRDIKSSNILLTERCRAKVADFGFARVAAGSEQTHVSTQVKGTVGYLDPEYLVTYQLTEKSDVYSFGVLLVELITGRYPIEPRRIKKECVTPKWAIMKFSEGEALATMDPRIEVTTANTAALEKILELAFICLAPRRQNRPTMKRCAEILWSIRKDYKELLASDTCSLAPGSRRHCSTENDDSQE